MSLKFKNGIIIHFDTLEELIKGIVKILEKIRWSDAKLARESKIPQSTVTRILTNKVRNPGMLTFGYMINTINEIEIKQGG